MAGAAASGMTRITLSFLLSLLSDNNLGPEAPANSKHHWSYKGPEGPQNWPIHYKSCAGEKQSPIDIKTSGSVYDSSLGVFHLDNFDTYSQSKGPTMLNITNNGHAASVRVTSNMRVSSGGLNGTYKTAEFHFHWGSTDEVGSEHALDGRKFPLEMHVVNFAEKYGTIQEAMVEPDGLAVLGVFFELSDTDNLEFSGLGAALNYIQKAGEHNLVNRVRLRSLLPEDISRYWRYSGSLTTPLCFESVTWTVFATPQKISRSQLDTLRSLLHENGHDKNEHPRNNNPSRLVDNWRPVQPLNGRTVYRSFEGRPRGDSYASNTRSSTSENNAIVVKPTDNHIIHSDTGAPHGGRNAIRINFTNPIEQLSRANVPFPPKVKIKIDPTSIPKTNSVGSPANPTSISLNKDYKDTLTDLSGTQFQSDIKNYSISTSQGNDYTLNKNSDVIQLLKKQQKLIELQTQQQIQKLIQLQQQQQQLNKQLELSEYSQGFGGGSSLLPNVQALDAQTQPVQLPIQVEAGRSFRNGARILNDGAVTIDKPERGAQAFDTKWPRQPSQLSIQQQQQQKQRLNSLLTSSSTKNQQRVVEPLDPNFQFNFRRDQYPPQNQIFPQQRPQQNKQQQDLLRESPTTSFMYNSQLQNQRLRTQQQLDAKNSLFTQLNNQHALGQTKPTSILQKQAYRAYPEQQSRQQLEGMSRQQRQQIKPLTLSGTKMNPGQIRTLLEKLTSNTRLPAGPQTLMSPAARMLPPVGGANSISRPGYTGGRRAINSRDNAREIPRTTSTRLTDQTKNRVPPTLTSGMNPIPYSNTQRIQRVQGKIAPQIPNRRGNLPLSPSSSPSVASLPSPSSSLNFGNQWTYQYNRNRQSPSFNRAGGNNNNWFFTDTNAQGRQDDVPYVFLHRIQKPVRIRRPFYERLYRM